MCIFILAEAGVGCSNTDVGNKMEFMGHVPGIAMSNHDQRLGEVRSTLCKRVYRPVLAIQGLPVPASDLNPSTSIPLEKFSPWPNRIAARSEGSWSYW